MTSKKRHFKLQDQNIIQNKALRSVCCQRPSCLRLFYLRGRGLLASFRLASFRLASCRLPSCLLACLVLSCLLLSACGGKSGVSDISFRGEVADLKTFPQNLTGFAEQAGGNKPLLTQAQQSEQATRYKSIFYRPWSMTKSAASKKDAAWAVNNYRGKQSYTANGDLMPPDTWIKWTDNADIKNFPSLAWWGITVANAPLRALPTSTPYYLNPKKAGEGYPFDYLAYTTLWIGTPVFVSHVSKDRSWLFCETPLLSGWVPASAVAAVSDNFIAQWQSMPLGAVLSDNLPMGGAIGSSVGPASSANRANRANYLRIGTLLPMQNGNLIVPVRQGQTTHWQQVNAPMGSAGLFPVNISPNAIAALGNQIMGEPYGWGGIDFNRDCSSMLRDIYTPFGIWLPRNSSKQIQVGQSIDISAMDDATKLRVIRDFGEPFLTLIGMPGHVMLYVGSCQVSGGQWQPALFHDIWGARTQLDNGQQGRLIMGKVVITSLAPGSEYPEVQRAGTILNKIKTVTIMP